MDTFTWCGFVLDLENVPPLINELKLCSNQSVIQAVAFIISTSKMFILTFHIVRPQEVKDLNPRVMTKMVDYFSTTVFIKCAPEALYFFFSLPSKTLGWVNDFMRWSDMEITYPHSSWFPDTWKLRQWIAPLTCIPSGCVHSIGASLFGHCGPGRQGRHLLSVKPPPCLPDGWSLPDVEVSRGLRGRDTQTSGFRVKTTNVCALFHKIENTCKCETHRFNCDLNWVSKQKWNRTNKT